MASSSGYETAETDISNCMKGLQVLLVEDSSNVGEAIKTMLRSWGADVVGPAATTAEAERLLLDHSADVALIDFHLRGGEVSSALIARLNDQGIPVIVTSGSGMDFLPPIKAVAILEKPFSELRLLEILYPLIPRGAAASHRQD